METTKLTAEPRSEAGTGVAKRLRRAGKIPAVLYGGGTSEPIVLDARDFRHAIHGKSGGTIFSLAVGGQQAATAIVKEIQRDSTRDEITHVDFQTISMDEVIHATLPIRAVGEAPGVKMGGVVQHATWEIDVQSKAKDMPEAIEIDLSPLNIGDSIHVADLSMPEGVEILTSPEAIIVSVLVPTVIVEEVEEVAEEEGLEGEGAEAGERAPETPGEGEE